MKRLVLLACMLFSFQFVHAQTAAEKKEEIEGILTSAKYILTTPADTTDLARDMSMMTIGMWMMTTEDYKFDADSATARIMNEDVQVATVFMAAMVEYQIKKKEPVYNKKVRLAVSKRVVKYIDDPANKIDLSKSLRLRNMVFNEKDGELEEWLDWLEKQKS